MSDRPRVVIVNRGSIILPPGDPLSAPLPGSEVVAINLAHGLAASGVPVTYIGNHRGSTLTGVQFRQVTELASVPDGTDLRVVWLRDYAAPDVTFARFPQARHFLLSEDSADDLRALSRWPVARIRARLHDIAAAANGVVFASEWHRTDWESRLGVRVPRGRVIYNLASHVPWRLDPPDAPRHRIIHTSHPRKALAAVAEIATRLVPDGFEVTCLSNPSLYQEESAGSCAPPRRARSTWAPSRISRPPTGGCYGSRLRSRRAASSICLTGTESSCIPITAAKSAPRPSSRRYAAAPFRW